MDSLLQTDSTIQQLEHPMAEFHIQAKCNYERSDTSNPPLVKEKYQVSKSWKEKKKKEHPSTNLKFE